MQSAVRLIIGSLLLGLLVLVSASLFYPEWFGRYYLDSGDVYRFPGLAGPPDETPVTVPAATPWQHYAAGSPSRLAVLLTDPDSAWLGLVHGLKAAGIPFRITRDVGSALEHRVVLVYPRIAGGVLDGEALRALATFVRDGGTLMAVNVLGGGLEPVFGFATAEPSRARFAVELDSTHPLAAGFADALERRIVIGHADPAGPPNIGTYHYTTPREPPLARYDDGMPAIVWRGYERGRAYAFGFDIGLMILQGHNFRRPERARSYVNGFEPSGDVVLRLIGEIYRSGEPAAFRLYSVPYDRPLSVVISHDIDYNESLANAVEYARLEQRQGIRATHLIQTKYVRDWNDEVFFDQHSTEYLRAIEAAGGEIGSHSVSHSKDFRAFPLGTGTERYPDYVPFVESEYVAHAGTVLGELRVSRYLLEAFATAPVVSFRAGHLENPPSLPQALAASGYRFDSTVPANTALTHWPYRLNFDRMTRSEVDVYELPVTLEDELDLPLLGRLDEAIALAERIARYGGSYVVLIHPNELGDKLEFQRRLVEALKPMAWFATMRELGEWWRARDAVELDVVDEGDTLRVELALPIRIAGLTLEIPAGFELHASSPASLRVETRGRRLVLAEAAGSVRLELRRPPGGP